MATESVPIILVFGPSGAGKSSLGARMTQDFNFQHLEIDRFPHDGIDLEALRPEWDAFWQRHEAQPLSQVVGDRASAGGYAGAVVTFPGTVVPSSSHMSVASRFGMSPIVLYGEASECLGAFLAREKATGRGFDEAHWHLNNRTAHPAFGAPEFAPYRVQTFERGLFRDASTVAREVRSRAG